MCSVEKKKKKKKKKRGGGGGQVETSNGKAERVPA